MGAPIRHAEAEAVRAATGFVIGGGRRSGTPHAVFPITPAELERITGARAVDLAAPPAQPQ